MKKGERVSTPRSDRKLCRPSSPSSFLFGSELLTPDFQFRNSGSSANSSRRSSTSSSDSARNMKRNKNNCNGFIKSFLCEKEVSFSVPPVIDLTSDDGNEEKTTDESASIVNPVEKQRFSERFSPKEPESFANGYRNDDDEVEIVNGQSDLFVKMHLKENFLIPI